MEIEEVNVGGPLLRRLQVDRDLVEREIAQTENGLRLLRFKLDYIKTLLTSAEAYAKDEAGHEIIYHESTRYAGLTIAEAAVRVLSEEGKPLAGIEIARRAMANGFEADNLERARSHFSAVISKDMKSANPRFWQVDRGLIGLVEWQTNNKLIEEFLNSSAATKDMR